jgi:cytochrome c
MKRKTLLFAIPLLTLTLTLTLTLAMTLAMTPALAPAADAPVTPAAPAIAAPAAMDGATLFVKKTCIACHGKDAKTPILPIYPKLAGQSADYAYNQMNDIKSGARNNGQTAAMKGVMHLVSEEEMRTIANWLATLQ